MRFFTYVLSRSSSHSDDMNSFIYSFSFTPQMTRSDFHSFISILLDRIIELEERVRLFEHQLTRHDPTFIHANAIHPQAATTGAYPRALATSAAQSAFAANLRKARDELDAEDPDPRAYMDRDRELQLRHRELASYRYAPYDPNSEVGASAMARKRMHEDSWRSETEEAAARAGEREFKRHRGPLLSAQHPAPVGNISASGPPPPPLSGARIGNGNGSGASGE
jgi:hypothetical protein